MSFSDLNFIAAAEFLTYGETPTRPYDVPVEELFDREDLVRPSSLCTVPLDLAELPDEAWPTELLLVTVED